MSQLQSAVTFTRPVEELKAIDPSTTEYLVLMVINGEDGESVTKEWEVITGREEVYEYIKTNIDLMDLDESKVLTAKVPYEGAKSVYEFLKFVREKMEDWEFDLEGYKN